MKIRQGFVSNSSSSSFVITSASEIAESAKRRLRATAKVTSQINRDCNILGSYRTAGKQAEVPRELIQRMNANIARRRVLKSGHDLDCLTGLHFVSAGKVRKVLGDNKQHRRYLTILDSSKPGTLKMLRHDDFLRAERVTKVY